MNHLIPRIILLAIAIGLPLRLTLNQQTPGVFPLAGTAQDEDIGEVGQSLAIDSIGNIIIIGIVSSRNFPTVGAFDPTFNGEADVFLAKFAANGTLLWSTFFGGSDNDKGRDVAIDGDNNIIVTGTTGSSDFPVLKAYDSTYNGDEYKPDAFVAKFAANGSLLWSTFFGGARFDYGQAVATDAANNVLVVGTTQSIDFPTNTAYDSTYNGGRDVFVAKFAGNGTLLWGTFFGGSSDDEDADIAVNSANNLLITGTTHSDNFPLLNAYDRTRDSFEAFVATLASNGSLLWSTLLGGSQSDRGYGVAVDNADQVLVTGSTESDDFPNFTGLPFTHEGGQDAFITKFAANGSWLWSTLFEGKLADKGQSITVDTQNAILMTGNTQSDDFPMFNAYDPTYNSRVEPLEENLGDCFLVKLSLNGSLLWSTFLGGSERDEAGGIAADPQNTIYVSGATESEDFPALNAYGSTHKGGSDVFIAKFAANGSLAWNIFLGAGMENTQNSPFLEFTTIMLAIGVLATIGSVQRRPRRQA